MSDTINVKIHFAHNARPYKDVDALASKGISFPLGALPNIGDTIHIDGIEHHAGSFVVSSRGFQLRDGSLYEVTLVLKVEMQI